jgi:hypothetical protein
MSKSKEPNKPKILDAFPEEKRRSKYDWDEWLDGKVRLLRRGEHYKTSTPTMRAVASSAAKKRDMRLRTKGTKDDDGCEALVIQALPLED